MRHSGRLIRSASLNGYVDLVESLGRDPHAFLGRVGLSAQIFDNPETLIPADAVRELLEITSRATRTEDFALRLAGYRTFSDLGALSLVLKEEPTPRQALDTLCRYLKLLNTSLIMRIEDVGNTVVIREDLVPSHQLPTRQSMELAIAVMFRILRELIGPQWHPLQVCFTHRAPADASAHRAFFGRSASFDQEFNGMVCAAADLQISRTSGNPKAVRFAREYLDTALQFRGEGLVEACREVVLVLLPGGKCTAQQVAQHLRVDRRTLHRHLSAQGMSFTALLGEMRSQLVVRHLRDSNLPLGEVASLLGFAAQSSFSHWFRATFGCSVSQWRAGSSSSQESPAGRSRQEHHDHG
ncbi:MAG: AraC family transcriptional regulator [Proteobacteria bacterium]|nr:AraC family transcriptional regulator [Pseudomonadota bacterium]